MKKSLLLLAFALCPLISCNNGGSSNPVTEEFTLTTSNFGTYVATHTTYEVIPYTSTSYSLIYHTDFEGADGCRFKNCSLVGYYLDSTEFTIKLTLSGDGETPYYSSQTWGKNFTLKSCTGTVIVYK